VTLAVVDPADLASRRQRAFVIGEPQRIRSAGCLHRIGRRNIGQSDSLVTFRDGGAVIGSVSLRAAGESQRLDLARRVPHSITATFAGNASFAASVSTAGAARSPVPQDSIKLRNLQVVERGSPRKRRPGDLGTIEGGHIRRFCRRRSVDYAERLGLRLTSSGQGKGGRTGCCGAICGRPA